MGAVMKRTKKLYDPSVPFKLSRSKLDLFLECQRCFYLDRKLGVKQPAGLPFTLNSLVDTLVKKEFDIHRNEQTPHPLFIENKLDNVVPFKHEALEQWRKRNVGVQHHHADTNFIITGEVDDVWIDLKTQELIVADIKATAKSEPVSLDADWQICFKRQVEVYQWLLRKNGFKVSNTAYFVYCNGKKSAEMFNGRIEFDISLIAYKGDDSWIDGAIKQAHQCLQADTIPLHKEGCDVCQYFLSASEVMK
jgi:hypothetical protein